MRVLFATAECRPLIGVGGLGEASSGLVGALRADGVDVITALPAYQRWWLDDEEHLQVARPHWAGEHPVRLGHNPDIGRLALVEGPGIERPDPYVDERGQGWGDNDLRFAAFSAAVAGLASELEVDVVHLNDWHTGLAPAFLAEDLPTVLTIHNLAHQGWTGSHWLHTLPRHRLAYARDDAVNVLGGAVQLADRVVAVSPTYAAEITTPEGGLGLEDLLAARGSDLRGILNGIDTGVWDPAIDPHVPQYGPGDLGGKTEARKQLLDRVGWEETGEPLIVMVTRLVDQKGVDLAFGAARFLDGVRARLIVLGSGEPGLAEWGHRLAAERPTRIWFHEGYDAPLSHLLFAGGDLLLMPSRFEPCGLAQMQAMAYGTIPVATPVGGLCDTVVDADAGPGSGNGFLAAGTDEAAVVDALHRAVRAILDTQRRATIRHRGMTRDWSWVEPARQYRALYDEVLTGRAEGRPGD